MLLHYLNILVLEQLFKVHCIKLLAQKDYNTFETYSSAKRYLKIIAEILLVYIVILFIYFGFVKDTGYTPIYSITLIISISISSFAQYYFGICNSLLS